MTSKLLLSGGCVLTLGAKTPNFLRADVLIDDGVVAEIGTGLRARDAETVDATDAIVMPGFVDTHRHAWTSLFRNAGIADDVSADPARFDERYGPDDVYAATLIGLLGAAEAGITTVVDWSPLPAEGGLAAAALRAHADSGLRTVFVHAPRLGSDGPAASWETALSLLRANAGPATTIAFGSAVPGPGDDDVADAWARARGLGLRIHAHARRRPPSGGAIAAVAGRGLLGEDVTLVHPTGVDDADLEAIASSGAAISLAPSSEMAGGRGSPPIQELIDRDIRPGLGVDDERVAPGDLFAQMRETISLQHATVFDRKLAGKAGVPKLMSTRDVIRSATSDGARVAGLAGVSGSLEPGLQADVIVLRTDRPNVFPINDPIGAVVWGMDTSNVDWVLVGGRVMMRNGLLEADVARARALAEAARVRIAPTGGIVAVSGGAA
ncbi:MAG TPA: amidohydrolase family protein [Actinomycetota bacterium]